MLWNQASIVIVLLPNTCTVKRVGYFRCDSEMEGERQNKINVSLTLRFLNWVVLGYLVWLCGQYLILNLVGYVDKARIFPNDFDRYKNVLVRYDEGIEKKLTESDWGRCVVKM